ncbi:MAG: hypothetical protein Q9M50_05170 [Methylococcales bacterium]|nr:hypothetical protein [Methylococcales bacterium]
MFDVIYLHIGLDKTGSKAIQFACCENAAHLSSARIFYPVTPDTVWHAEFASFFHQDPKTYAYNQAIGRSQKALAVIQSEDRNYIRNLEQKIQQTNAKTMVLSYEGFAFLEGETLEKMRDYLQGISKQVKIILYCREPVSYAISAVSQRAISMSALWGNAPIQLYKPICEKFVSIFGKENMIVRDFSKNKLVAGDVRQDFFEQIKFNDPKALNLSTAGENRSLCYEAISIAQALRTRCQQEQIPEAEFSWRYASILQKIKGVPYTLNSEQLRDVYSNANEHSDYLRENFSIAFIAAEKNQATEISPTFSSDFMDSIAEVICNPREFTPPLVPEVKTDDELTCPPFIGRLEGVAIPDTLIAGKETLLTIELFNDSDFNWLSQGLNPSYLSYHWQQKSGEMLIFEGLRSSFSTLGLPHGQSLTATMQVSAPLEVGSYYLILTLVKENICWFEENGFEPFKTMITVSSNH